MVSKTGQKIWTLANIKYSRSLAQVHVILTLLTFESNPQVQSHIIMWNLATPRMPNVSTWRIKSRRKPRMALGKNRQCPTPVYHLLLEAAYYSLLLCMCNAHHEGPAGLPILLRGMFDSAPRQTQVLDGRAVTIAHYRHRLVLRIEVNSSLMSSQQWCNVTVNWFQWQNLF